MIIIGSTAIKYWYSDFPREPKDLDIIGDKKDLILSYGRVEQLSNPVLEEYYNGGSKYLPPNLLYTLKVSHIIGWNINWEKHLWDIQFLKRKGAILDRKLFNLLYAFWPTIHSKNKRSDLEMSAEDFFTNSVDCPHEHDYLHTIINPNPTFKKILKDEVEVCETKIKELGFEEKCDLIREEVMVMASERYKGMTYKIRYSRMLKKFILNHAPLEVGIFAIENYPLLEKPSFNFMQVINEHLEKQGLQILN